MADSQKSRAVTAVKDSSPLFERWLGYRQNTALQLKDLPGAASGTDLETHVAHLEGCDLPLRVWCRDDGQIPPQ
jgi:hypothetical protein